MRRMSRKPAVKPTDDASRGRLKTAAELIEQLKSEQEGIAYSATWQIVAMCSPGTIDPNLIDALILALRHESPMVREGAAVALGSLREPRAVGPLIATLSDSYDDYEWRPAVQAQNALCKIGEPSVEPLIAALRNDNEHIRFGAVQTLMEIHDSRAAEPLISSLEDKAAGVRMAAAIALGGMGEADALGKLKALARQDEGVWGRQRVADAAAEAIKKIERRLYMLPWLVGLLDDLWKTIKHAL